METGVSMSLRRLFAFVEVKTRNVDFSTVEHSPRSSPRLFGRSLGVKASNQLQEYETNA